MDIKFSTIARTIFLASVILFGESNTGVVRPRGNHQRVILARHQRRDVRDYLVPPSPDFRSTEFDSLDSSNDHDYHSFSPSLIPYRPGKRSNLSPSTTESPGYFARIATWLNPFGGSSTSSNLETRRIPPESRYSSLTSIPQPPPPPGNQGYLPPKFQGKECHPCDKFPWIPLSTDVRQSDSNIRSEISEDSSYRVIPPSTSFVHDIRTPDFAHVPPIHPHAAQLNLVPLPYPHLYPGPMPPLFKSKPFRSENSPTSSSSMPAPSPSPPSSPSEYHEYHDAVRVSQIIDVESPSPSGYDYENKEKEKEEEGQIFFTPPPSDYHANEQIFSASFEDNREIVESNVPIIVNDHETSDVRSASNISLDPSRDFNRVVDENTKTGYERVRVIDQNVGNVEISKSVTSPGFASTVHYEESPLFDLTKIRENDDRDKTKKNRGKEKVESIDSFYAIGLNPPPPPPPPNDYTGDKNENNYSSPFVFDSPLLVNESSNSSIRDVPKNSYGVPLIGYSPKDKDSVSSSSNFNESVFEPTPSDFPDVAELPVIDADRTKTTEYEIYPPTTGISSIAGITTSDIGLVDDRYHRSEYSSKGPFVLSNSNESKLFRDHHSDSRTDNTSSRPPLVDHVIRESSSINVPYRSPYDASSTRSKNVTVTSSDPSSTFDFTTDEPFLDALLKSYRNFKQEMALKNVQPLGSRTDHISENSNDRTIYSSIDNHPWGVSNDRIRESNSSNGKQNKQVQIIIPYTSQHSPSPFRSTYEEDWSGHGDPRWNQGRKVPKSNEPDDNTSNYVGEASRNVEIKDTSSMRTGPPLESLLAREFVKRPTMNNANNSIDVSRLQKNIDNWTIQEYSTSTLTSSTARPSSAHPYLLPSKNIPNEYLTTAQPSTPEDQRIIGGPDFLDLDRFNSDDFEREPSASVRVDVTRLQIINSRANESSSSEKFLRTPELVSSRSNRRSTDSTESTESTLPPTDEPATTRASWARLLVSVSPHNNERVYVVTPEPEGSFDLVDEDEGKSFERDNENSNANFPRVNSNDRERIERAYQVLPQAVNNLALGSASGNGPERVPLWGIMEHDRYAERAKETGSSSLPILYTGHSKISETRH